MPVKSLQSNRGSVLIVAVGAIAVMLVMVVSVVKWTGTAGASISSKVAGDKMEACAKAARRYLLTQISLNGGSASEVKIPAAGSTADIKMPDDTGALQTKIYTGHYAETATGGTTAEATVSLVSGGAMGSSRSQVRDLTNALPSSTVLGGQYFRVVVKCRQEVTYGDDREAEYEFVFRYGM